MATPDIHGMARAMFDHFHTRENRPRNWDNHPEEDAGIEAGRNTWVQLAGIAAATPTVEAKAAAEAKAANASARDAAVAVAQRRAAEPAPATMVQSATDKQAAYAASRAQPAPKVGAARVA